MLKTTFNYKGVSNLYLNSPSFYTHQSGNLVRHFRFSEVFFLSHQLLTVLVDFPAEVGLVSGVGGAVLEELQGLGRVGTVLIEEGVGAVVAVVGIALVTLYAGA